MSGRHDRHDATRNYASLDFSANQMWTNFLVYLLGPVFPSPTDMQDLPPASGETEGSGSPIATMSKLCPNCQAIRHPLNYATSREEANKGNHYCENWFKASEEDLRLLQGERLERPGGTSSQRTASKLMKPSSSSWRPTI